MCNFRSIFQKFTDADHIYIYVCMDAVEEIIFPRFVPGVINYVANLIYLVQDISIKAMLLLLL